MRIMIFNIVILLSRLGSLMICTLDLYILTKRKKKRSAVANRSDTVAKVLSTNVSIIVTEFMYLQKMDQTSPSWASH
jgi:Mn2+/Fe2+ NRAMP family transporter